MNDACRLFRCEWLDAEGAELAHARECPECARWAQSTRSQRTLLSGLSRLEAPAELEARVASELAGSRSRRLERVLSSLARRGAPALLDERVAGLFVLRGPGDEQRGEQKAQAMRALELPSAPEVLERLVGEELDAPARHRVERFAGSLERVPAPHALEARLGAAVRRRALSRLVLGPLVTLVAAGLVVWFAIGQDSEPRARRFQVIHAASLDELDPLARSLAESLSGGGAR